MNQEVESRESKVRADDASSRQLSRTGEGKGWSSLSAAGEAGENKAEESGECELVVDCGWCTLSVLIDFLTKSFHVQLSLAHLMGRGVLTLLLVLLIIIHIFVDGSHSCNCVTNFFSFLLLFFPY